MTRRSKPRTYSDQFKTDAVGLVKASGKPVAQVARDLGISKWTLQNWVSLARQDRPVSDNETGRALDADERAELLELRKLVHRQAQDLEILGKATAWFANRNL